LGITRGFLGLADERQSNSRATQLARSEQKDQREVVGSRAPQLVDSSLPQRNLEGALPLVIVPGARIYTRLRMRV
jgi:hypothetical protein